MNKIQFFYLGKPIQDEDIKIINSGSKSQNEQSKPDLEFVKLIRLLEYSDEYSDWIKQLRKKFGIPANGYDWKENNILTGCRDVGKIEKRFLPYLSRHEIAKFNSLLAMKYRNRMSSFDWQNLITSNAMEIPFADDPDVYLHDLTMSESDEGELIIRFPRKFTKKQLKNLIDLHWADIEKLASQVDKDSLGFAITDNDLYVLEAKELRKLTHRKIADEIEEKRKDKKLRIDNTARQAYFKAKKKAATTFSTN